ncbi:MAG TPA: LuxR C-terminal-related transcriptional regulator [Acidimicrobiales bacterium]|nr:LuxR C-terminal-related transcriptional regulator [Acidimicrobiales bacterium]
MRIYEQALQLVSDGGVVLRRTADMHVGMGEIHRERHDLHAAAEALRRSLALGEHNGRTGAVIEILVVQALARDARGDAPAALASLRRAVTLAEPEGYVHVFADEGPPMTALLQARAKESFRTDYVRRLLAAASPGDPHRPVKQPLVDPLSDRELDVLRLLASDLGGPEIARELSVSLNTIRTHTKNIYAKLGVNNRRAAVRRGQELQLFAGPRRR